MEYLRVKRGVATHCAGKIPNRIRRTENRENASETRGTHRQSLRLGDGIDAIGYPGTPIGHAGIWIVALKNLKRLQSRRNGKRIACERPCLIDRPFRGEAIHVHCLAANRRQRQTAANDLAERYKIRLYSGVQRRICGKTETKAVYDLVADEK